MCTERKTPTPKPAFHLHSNMPHNISMHNAEMAIETCTNIPYEDRAECYVAFGVDGRAVEEYFYIVQSMERCFHNNSFYKSNQLYERLPELYNAPTPRIVRSAADRLRVTTPKPEAPELKPPADPEEL